MEGEGRWRHIPRYSLDFAKTPTCTHVHDTPPMPPELGAGGAEQVPAPHILYISPCQTRRGATARASQLRDNGAARRAHFKSGVSRKRHRRGHLVKKSCYAAGLKPTETNQPQRLMVFL